MLISRMRRRHLPDFYGLPPDAWEVIAAVRLSTSISFLFAPVRTVTRPAQTPKADGDGGAAAGAGAAAVLA